jgi:hypothetical protein
MNFVRSFIFTWSFLNKLNFMAAFALPAVYSKTAFRPHFPWFLWFHECFLVFTPSCHTTSNAWLWNIICSLYCSQFSHNSFIFFIDSQNFLLPHLQIQCFNYCNIQSFLTPSALTLNLNERTRFLYQYNYNYNFNIHCKCCWLYHKVSCSQL